MKIKKKLMNFFSSIRKARVVWRVLGSSLGRLVSGLLSPSTAGEIARRQNSWVAGSEFANSILGNPASLAARPFYPGPRTNLKFVFAKAQEVNRCSFRNVDLQRNGCYVCCMVRTSCGKDKTRLLIQWICHLGEILLAESSGPPKWQITPEKRRFPDDIYSLAIIYPGIHFALLSGDPKKMVFDFFRPRRYFRSERVAASADVCTILDQFNCTSGRRGNVSQCETKRKREEKNRIFI